MPAHEKNERYEFGCNGSKSSLNICLEEDKRATTNVQNGLVFFFLLSKKNLNFKKNPRGEFLKMCEEVWRITSSVKKCRNDFAL